MKVVAVVQARMGSTRLPGKVLKRLDSRPALEWAATAAARAVGTENVVVATSTNPENDAIQKFCDGIGLRCIRGSEDDVLDRYRKVVEETKADVIVRITADCPLIDSNVIRQVIALYKSDPSCMYASNTDPPTWPDGLDCEVISADAIMVAAEEATRPSDRDTVTRYIARNRTKFPAKTLICPLPGLHKERWVLDSLEDYEFILAIIGGLDIECVVHGPSYLDILDLLERHPELRDLLGPHWRNQRFYESISVEKHIRTDFRNSDRQFSYASKMIPTASQTFSKSHLQYPPGGPLFLSHGDGGYAFDVDGNDYVDMVSALLPNVLGYCDPDVDYAIRSQLSSGISFSLSTALEAELAKKLIDLIPCADMVKFGKNGSDVTSAAVRVARAYTGRPDILMLKKGYHGWQDWSVADTERGLGVPNTVASRSHRCTDDLGRIENALSSSKYAAIIVEPEGRTYGWLYRLKELCQQYGTLLVFDEVITGFRWHLGGYQKYIGVTPNLATFGKAMANGMPLSALVGDEEIMECFDPPDNIFYSGTFFGEALSLAASIATINKMQAEQVIAHLWIYGDKLRDQVIHRIVAHDLMDVIQIHGDGPLVRLTFRRRGNFAPEIIAGLFRKWMIESGTLIIASHNICFAHGETEIARVVASYDYALPKLEEALKSAIVPQDVAVGAGVR